ncbi:MAG: leucine-rich repeat domain-containing protein, partial [Clostridia bacterium]|nr:leucine-rich repeat domain-containing protein [Clostridia bacterium]
MKTRIFAAIIAAVFVVLNVASALPVLALDESTTRYPTPEGYNNHDYQKLVAFLEQTDDEGVKNGEKCNYNYDPNDPTTWGTYWDDQRFQWIESDGELRIQRIDVDRCGLCGTLDVSGCTALTYLDCRTNNLTSLDVSGCTALTYLECSNNNLTGLDVSNNTALTSLSCYDNNLTGLDVSNNTALEHLSCGYNNLTGLDVSNN